MDHNEIKFGQERDFGELFNATFSFIGQEFKRLATAVLYYVVPFLLVVSILGVMFGIHQQQNVNVAMSSNNPMAVFQRFGLFFFLDMLLVIIAVTSLNCTILGYVKLYVRSGSGNFTVKEVGDEVMRNFFPVLGASVIAGIVIGIGTVLCVIPGIYFGVSLSLLLPLIVIEGKGLGDAFGRSIKLVKPKFWMVLGALFVMVILVYLISILFSIPAMILGMKTLFMNMKHAKVESFDFSTGYYIINSITSLLTYIIGALPTILMAFLYYSLVESNEKPLLKDKIDQISVDE